MVYLHNPSVWLMTKVYLAVNHLPKKNVQLQSDNTMNILSQNGLGINYLNSVIS